MSTATQRAQAALDAGRPELAVRSLETAVADDGGDVHVWCLLALAHLRLSDFDTALAAANRAVAVAPEEEWGHRLASLCLSRKDLHLEAIRAAQEAVRCAPYQWTGHVRCAAALREYGDFRAALQAADRAVELGPFEDEAHVEAGRVLLDLNQPDRAEQAFTQALALDPENAVARHELARAQLRKKDYAGAVNSFGSAARMDPRLTAAVVNIELVIRGVIQRSGELALLVAWAAWLIVGSVLDSSDNTVTFGSRLVCAGAGAAVVGVLAVLLGRHGLRLTPTLRQAAVSVVRRDRFLLVATVSMLACPLVFFVGAVLPPTGLQIALVAALLLGLVARLGCARSGRAARKRA